MDADAQSSTIQKPGGRLFEALVQSTLSKKSFLNGELNRPLLAKVSFYQTLKSKNGRSKFKGRLSVELWLLREKLAQTEEIFFMDIFLLFEQDYSANGLERLLVSMWRDAQK